MPAVARHGDIIGHGVTPSGILVVTKFTNVTIDLKPVIKVGDVTTCSHAIHLPATSVSTTVETGSSIVKAQENPIARVGDNMSCGAIILTGSPKVNAN